MSKKKDAPFNNPFSALKLPEKPKAPDAAAKRAPPPPAKRQRTHSDDDVALFYEALDGVMPISNRGTASEPEVALPPRVDDEAEALAELAQMVSGQGSFDVSDSTELLEGVTQGLDPRVLRALRRGQYPVQAKLDLHGLTQAEAQRKVEVFLTDARRDQRRCVLIVHGRGLNSEGQVPVLKEGLRTWLTEGRAGKIVLAFTSARPHEGGAGAAYVLLRR